MSTDTHDKLIAAFQNYCHWQDRFEFGGSDSAGVKARSFLSEIRDLAKQRRAEIAARKELRREIRSGLNGRPKNIIKGDGY
jgi:hypothetical protein